MVLTFQDLDPQLKISVFWSCILLCCVLYIVVQFAYHPGRAVDDAIGLLQFYVTAGFNSCPGVTRVAVLSLDLRKAFDSVPVHKLVDSLQNNFGLPDTLAHLVRSYLSNRVQTTCIGGEESFQQSVISGVPQGSILGPHLFNAYVTTALRTPVSDNTRLLAFADDLLIIKPIRSQADVEALQSDIDAVLSAYNSLFLTINPAKSAYMICSLANPAGLNQMAFSLFVNGIQIEQKECLKYLGVIIDADLSFARNTELIAPKAKRAIGAFWRTLGKYSARNTFAKIYKAKILPLLLHALPVASPVQVQHWKLLEKVNRFACRLIANDY